MTSKKKTCQNCKQEFRIEPEDFDFYKKIDVPPPTWCPECRLIRRMTWLNDRNLYKRTCDAPGHNEEIFSVYSSDTPAKVYDHTYWYSDEWNPIDYGRKYDFSVSFFEQLNSLVSEVPWFNLLRSRNAVNSPYTNNVGGVKNCYLVFHAGLRTEDCYYSQNIIACKNVFDSFLVKNSELCYQCTNCIRCFRAFFSIDCENSTDIFFCKNCNNCSNCFGCVNLRNKKYHIFNKHYSKEEYAKKLYELDPGSQKKLVSIQKKVQELSARHIVKHIHGRHNQNVSGDYINYSKNALNCFNVRDVEDSKYCHDLDSGPISYCYDYTAWGNNATLMYDCLACGHDVSKLHFSKVCKVTSSDLKYCMFITASSNLFGCVGLRNKQYCILNKQYSKEEYEQLVPKIIKHMNKQPYIDSKGRVYTYGEFFPPEFSPFAYNETIAQEYFPLTKEEAEEQGYRWREPETKEYEITIKPDDLPDHIKDVQDSIFKETIGCEHQGKCNEQCTTAFKIIPQELQFYKKMNLSLPRLCPNCRHYQRLKQHNPLKLWHQKCQCAGTQSENGIYTNTSQTYQPHTSNEHCPNEFETSYAPDRKEIIYCEQCYQAEVV